eukprot:COSAG01_NODE_3761_length_5722_cov_2.962298_11_plen_218_part_00
MANTANLHDAAVALDLGHIRQSLRRMEDSIIFSLIERTQYRINHKVYEPDCEEKIYPPQLLSPSLPPLPVPSPPCLPSACAPSRRCCRRYQVRRSARSTCTSSRAPARTAASGTTSSTRPSACTRRRAATSTRPSMPSSGRCPSPPSAPHRVRRPHAPCTAALPPTGLLLLPPSSSSSSSSCSSSPFCPPPPPPPPRPLPRGRAERDAAMHACRGSD